MAPLDGVGREEHRNNLPAQIELYATDGDAYKFLFMAKGGGSANKSYLFQETKAVLNPRASCAFLDEKLRALGTAACPPYHLAVVIGGTSAEYTPEGGEVRDRALPRHAADDRATNSAAGSATSSSKQQVLEITQNSSASARSSAASTSATTCA